MISGHNLGVGTVLTALLLRRRGPGQLDLCVSSSSLFLLLTLPSFLPWVPEETRLCSGLFTVALGKVTTIKQAMSLSSHG